jgi:hypothetical protein
MGEIMRIDQVARFSLGRLVATPAALKALERAGIGTLALLARHQSGDWGQLCAEDGKTNEEALKHGGRLLSAYPVGDARIWVITEADRSATTILLPEEY